MRLICGTSAIAQILKAESATTRKEALQHTFTEHTNARECFTFAAWASNTAVFSAVEHISAMEAAMLLDSLNGLSLD